MNRRGDVFLTMIGIALAVILVFTFFYYAINRGMNRFMDGPSFDPQFQGMVDEWKSRAPLILVGTIQNVREQVNETADKETKAIMSYLVMNIRVEQVERGAYRDESINAYFGWFSSEGDEDDNSVPSQLKKDYQKGDRIRIYLDYDKQRYGYYTPWSYYTIELLPS